MPSRKDLERQLLGITQQQLDLSKRLFGEFESAFREGRELERPQVDLLRAIISGDKDQIARMLATPLSEAVRQQRQARENIFRSVAPGAGREWALAQLEREMPSEAASWVRQLWASAFPSLYQIGAERGDEALALLGAAFRPQEAATAGLHGLLDIAARRKASTLGFLGSLAQVIGGGVAGALGGKPSGAIVGALGGRPRD